MWSKTYSTRVTDLNAAQVWKVWTDVNQWHSWQDDIEFARLDGEFASGKQIQFRPKGGPNIRLHITEVQPQSLFVDVTRFPLAKMYDSHELIDHGDQLEIKSTIRVEGPLAFLWRKLVAENVANGLPQQTQRLLDKVRHG